jgi:dolichyl-phosphate-mannose--protein O-mannosyl transferase
MYINRLFHFDSNPPFAKQLIAIAGYWAGYGKQNETFDKIGKNSFYPSSMDEQGCPLID